MKKKHQDRPQIAKPAPRIESQFARSPWAYVAASFVLLIPCFWQSRIQAGDLGSHIYNAWLVQLIEQGQAPGLSIQFQTTNVLFDWMLSAGLRAFGPDAAQRLAVGLAVLAFAWGGFGFVSTVSQRRAWNMLPWIGLLAYGWVFHMGFFGFYLSLGLCFAGLACAWDWKPRGIACAVAFFGVAYVAHALPVMWAGGVLLYARLARAIDPRHHVNLVGGALAAIVLLRVAVGSTLTTRWAPQQFTLVTGLDQFWVFDTKYVVSAGVALIVWILLLRRLAGVWRGIPAQICLVTAAGIAILPTAVLIPGYQHVLAYIAERLSLALAVCVCAVLAAAPPRAYDRYATAAAAIMFLGLLYHDERLLNGFEDRMAVAAAQIPPSQRVVAGIEQSDLRVNAIAHMIDRVCVGRCYSYANYEPSTWQFRVRVNAPNPIVAATYEASAGLQTGAYVIRERDLPLYQLLADDAGAIQVRIPPAGQPCGVTAVKVL